MHKLAKIALFICLSMSLTAVHAAPITTFNFGSADFVENPSDSLMYASVENQDDIEVINENTLSVVGKIPVGSDPTGLALSPDGSTLYVADSGSNNIGVVSTTTDTMTNTLNAPGGDPTSVVVGNDNRLWVLSGGGIHQIDDTTGDSTGPDLSQGAGMYPLLIN
jgi:YVTN family beta-propeller protein